MESRASKFGHFREQHHGRRKPLLVNIEDGGMDHSAELIEVCFLAGIRTKFPEFKNACMRLSGT
jgi:hypothetical protein